MANDCRKIGPFVLWLILDMGLANRFILDVIDEAKKLFVMSY